MACAVQDANCKPSLLPVLLTDSLQEVPMAPPLVWLIQ